MIEWAVRADRPSGLRPSCHLKRVTRGAKYKVNEAPQPALIVSVVDIPVGTV